MRVLSVVCILLVLSSVGLGQLSGRNNLKGLPSVTVIVGGPLSQDNETSAYLETLGLTTQTIKNDTELRLIKAGIKTLSKAPFPEDVGSLNVLFEVSPAAAIEGLYVYSVRIELVQTVRLIRSPNLQTSAVTYSEPAVYGFAGKPRLGDLKSFLNEKLDVFISDYLEMNPKK